MSTALIPLKSEETRLEEKYTRALIKVNPGLGEKASQIAFALVDEGIPKAVSTAIINVVYAPNDKQGRGQTTRFQWLSKALARRREAEIASIRSDTTALRRLLIEIENVVDLRDTVLGEGLDMSFEEAYIVSEVGIDAEAFLGLIFHHAETSNPGLGCYRVKKACRMVQEGKAISVEGALDELQHGKSNW